jgi:hypothetical protein
VPKKQALDLGIGVREIDHPIPFTMSEGAARTYASAIRNRKWMDAARIVYDLIDDELVKLAILLAIGDRAAYEMIKETQRLILADASSTESQKKRATFVLGDAASKGGVLLEARDRTHAEKLTADLRRTIPDRTFRVGGLENVSDSDYGIIVVPKGSSRRT